MKSTKKTTFQFDAKKIPVFYEGNLDILKEYPVIGVLASGKAPGPVVWESYEIFYALRDEVITLAGAWHSPLEKGILDSLVEGSANVAFFLAKGLKSSGFKQRFRVFNKASRGLMITPFSADVTKIRGTEATRLRNEILAATSDVLFIPYIRPKGKLFKMINGDETFLRKTFLLSRPENADCSLNAQRIESNHASVLIRASQEAHQRKIS
ncbi:MAG: hypothetical protein JRI80_13600 [Deltaproteobacteria bacterium]|nr:hypothetical protein [Deltaproteobacteria bacterium]MBW2095914.1 hypothetical protein [Deltaproteobacteria bacterium]